MSYVPPGQPYPGQPYPGYPIPQRTSGLAVGSLVCSLIFCIPLITPVVAIALGAAALPAIGRGETKGRGIAIAGIVIGLLVLLLVQPVAGFGIYKAVEKGKELVAKPAVDYARAVAAGDIQTATQMSAATWTKEDSEALSADLVARGKLADTTIRSIQFVAGAGGRGGLTVHVELSFSDGKTALLSVQLTAPPPPGGRQFEVSGAQVLP